MMAEIALAAAQAAALPGLFATGPNIEGPGAALYAPLVGSWDVDVVDVEPDGTRHTTRGEWHVAWVLEGRAIQDVFSAPARGARPRGLPLARNRYGTTLRVYDAKADAGQVTWTNPVRNVRNTLVGRAVGAEIVQEGRQDDGALFRWTFSDLTSTAFRWRGETSTDDGRTWTLGAEFVARRRP